MVAGSILSSLGAPPAALAQNPFPTGLARSTIPGQPEPNDGADVLVVEGTNAGAEGCSPSLDLIKYITVAALNNNRRTITQITPQNTTNPGLCNAPMQYWKDAVASITEHVVTYADNWEAYWGGIMLDEEDGFWNVTDSVAAFSELNQHTKNVLLFLTQGQSWYFTETFVSQDAWTQGEFNQVASDSVLAPQIATDFMVDSTNSYRSSTGRTVLVTWSLHEDYGADFRSLYRAESRITGAPYARWGLNLSNCFTSGTPCGPDQDDDGLVAYIEAVLGTSDFDKDTDDDGCSDGEETGIFPSLGGSRNAAYFWDFFDVTGDKHIDFSDTLDILAFFGDPALPGTPGNLRDRDIGGPGDWNTVESNTGVDMSDTLASLPSFGHGCTEPP
jgi:hypothetical protein